MTDIAQTPLAFLDAEGRLLSPVYKGQVSPDMYAFRGELALKFAEKLSDEARPPEIKLDQVMMTAPVHGMAISFFAGFGVSLEHLGLLRDLLADKLNSSGRYFFFAGNLDISKRYRIVLGSATFWVLPLDEATVYNEMLELLGIDRGDLKKLDTAGKLRVIAEKAIGFRDAWPEISFDEGLRIMGPVKIKENRPV